MESFLSELVNEKEILQTQKKLYLNDEYLHAYHTKFLFYHMNNDEVQLGGADDHDAQRLNFNETYAEIAAYHKILNNKSYDLVNIAVRDQFFRFFHEEFQQIFDISQAIAYLYTIDQSVVKKPFFPTIDYVINKTDKRTAQTVLTMIDLEAAKVSYHKKGIKSLFQYIIEHNVAIDGTFVLYFHFAPWLADYRSYFLDLLQENFTSVRIVYPVLILPISNKCFIICEGKMTKKKIVEDKPLSPNLYLFCLKITNYIWFNLRILFNLIDAKIEQEDLFTVMSNKIYTHFRSLDRTVPDVV